MLRGTVIYHLEKIGFGLVFSGLDDEQKATITELVEQSGDKPAG